MIEKHIVLEDIDPIMFYGVGNCHLQMVKSLFPKLRIMARGNVLRVLGDEEEIAKIEEDVETDIDLWQTGCGVAARHAKGCIFATIGRQTEWLWKLLLRSMLKIWRQSSWQC